MGLLTGKTAVITGGTSGIGLATAKRFVDEGAHVFITGRRQAELETAVKELGDGATGVPGDVSGAEDLDRLYTAVADSGRRIDVVFANAAVIDVARIGDITEEHLDYLLDIDLKGVVFTVQKALPLLNDGGSIVLNSSTVAAPVINTSAGMLMPGANARADFENLQGDIVPLARLASPEEVAVAVSDLSSFTTGADIPVDGAAPTRSEPAQ